MSIARLQRFSLYYGLVIRARSSKASSSKTPNVVLEKNSSKKEAEKWRIAHLDRMALQLKKSNRRYGEEQMVKAAQAQFIRYTVADDIISLCSLTQPMLANKKSHIQTEIDKMISATLYAGYRYLSTILNTDQVDIRKNLSTAVAIGNLWCRLRVFNNDMRGVSILLYDVLTRFAEERTSKDEGLTDILSAMRRKLPNLSSKFRVSECSLYLSDSDRELMNNSPYQPPVTRSHSDLGYDKELSLVDPLRHPTPENMYEGNPFCVASVSNNNYMNLFSHNYGKEMSPFLRVDNICKSRSTNVVKSAEELIESWKWRQNIADTVNSLLPQRIQYPLKAYVSTLTPTEIADFLYESVVAICSMGQNLVPMFSFQYFLCTPILRKIHEKFSEKLGIDQQELWTRVFRDYSLYFEDADIARKYTHREWWYQACRKNNIPPDFAMLFSDFHIDARKQLSTFLTEVVVKACEFPGRGPKGRRELFPAFKLRDVAIEEISRVTDEEIHSLTPMAQLHQQMVKEFEEHQFDYLLFSTSELPMLIPPRPWIDGGQGGPEYTRCRPILRFAKDFKDVDLNTEFVKRLRNEKQARPVFDALNQLGSTPWIINEPMLDVLSEVFAMSSDPTKKDLLEKLGVPMRASTIPIPTAKDVMPEIPSDGMLPKEKWIELKKLERSAEKMRYETNSLWFWMMYRIVLAKHFRGQMLFFPHNMDFRGRVYPISPNLNHMGDDVNRCILKFAKGKPLGERGLLWLKLHCINLTGRLKRQSLQQRLETAENELPLITDSANSPLDGQKWWMKSEEPWQTLAACMELRDALTLSNPQEFISHLAVHQDGSCNGLQHYAALGRDRQGGEEVNLLPSESPNDVYSSVAARVELKRIEDENGNNEDTEIAKRLRLAMPQEVPRKVIKQTVMTTVYGVTEYGANLQIRKQLKALGIDGDDMLNFAAYLTDKTFASLHDAFKSSMQLKDWFRMCAKGACELMRTVEWCTPLGLPVTQPYLRPKDVSGRLVLAPLPMKQENAFPPNFVHSLDSTHMMLTSLQCARRGITFASVHDCFWTHASTVDEMNVICRQQFVNLHTEPLVQQCSKWFLDRYLVPSELSDMNEANIQRYKELFSPKVPPGELDINQVMDSVYFFS